MKKTRYNWIQPAYPNKVRFVIEVGYLCLTQGTLVQY